MKTTLLSLLLCPLLCAPAAVAIDAQDVLDEGYVGPDGKPHETGCWRCLDQHIGDQPFWTTCYVAHQLMVYYRYLPTCSQEAWGASAPASPDDRLPVPKQWADVDVNI